MGYGEPCGHPHLRRAIAAHLRTCRGITCDPEQVFIVGGAQQAFHLIGSMLIDPGEKVWFENPGAIGACNSLIACGAEMVPVPVDQEGMRVEDGLAACPKFRLAFVTPSHQQPLGTVMSLERRFALLNAAAAAGAWIIEDDYDGEFFFGGRPPPTLKSVDTTGLVIYVGTFSKSLFPSLRLGFILSPPSLIDVFRTIMNRLLTGVPTSSQATVAEFMEEGYFHTHVRRMRRLYAERNDVLCASAKRKLRRTAEGRSGIERTAHDRPSRGEPGGKPRGGSGRRAASNRVSDQPLHHRARQDQRARAGFRRRQAVRDRGRHRGARGGARGLCQTAPGVPAQVAKTVAGRPITGLLATT